MLPEQIFQPPSAWDRLAALVDRERRTRFATGTIGYLWAYIVPIAWIGFVVLAFRILDRAPPISVGPEIFVGTAFIPYIIFRNTVISLSRTVATHRHLLYIRPIEIGDFFTATSILEGYNLFAITFIICGGITVMFSAEPPSDMPQVLTVLLLVWALGTGVGRFVGVIGLLSDSFSRVVPILLRPVFWLSGIFYTATELPLPIQNILWFNPVFHLTELLREAYFLGYESPVASAWYPILVAAVFFVLSVPAERFAANRQTSRFRL
jgi:ABC-type polysaccharide/polyol phosphate export permease